MRFQELQSIHAASLGSACAMSCWGGKKLCCCGPGRGKGCCFLQAARPEPPLPAGLRGRGFGGSLGGKGARCPLPAQPSSPLMVWGGNAGSSSLACPRHSVVGWVRLAGSSKPTWFLPTAPCSLALGPPHREGAPPAPRHPPGERFLPAT